MVADDEDVEGTEDEAELEKDVLEVPNHIQVGIRIIQDSDFEDFEENE